MENVSQKQTTGLIIGKFLPPHRGHQYLIEYAKSRVGHLTVLVCSLECEPIPGHLRWAWMKELYPDAQVLHLTDENPSEPHEHPQFWEIWTTSIRHFLPTGPDFVFTSETYGDELACRLGAQHILVDLQRERFSISASLIRERPFENWSYIPECVRPYFVKRVAVVGPESTGKTTLAAQLAGHFQTVWVPEFARQYLAEKNLNFDLEDIQQIAKGQMSTEDQLARSANRLLICDTELITTTLWSQHFFAACPEWIQSEANRRQYDLYLLADIDTPWVADPQRVGDHLRSAFLDRLRQELVVRNRPYKLVSGSYDERFRKAVLAIEALFD